MARSRQRNSWLRISTSLFTNSTPYPGALHSIDPHQIMIGGVSILRPKMSDFCDSLLKLFNDLDTRALSMAIREGVLSMKWMRDSDLLITKTLALAQSVSAHRPIGMEPQAQDKPTETIALEGTATPKDKPFERDQINQRVADFKATQTKFQREREEYYNATMPKVR